MDYRLMTDVLRRFAGTLVHDYGLEDVLTRLSPDICRVLDVHGAGVMVEDEDGELRMLSTSDPLLGHLEELQIQLGEGPCLTAYLTGHPVHAHDLNDDPRFPAFGPKAVAVGMQAVYSYPMKWEGRNLGALNFYRTSAEPLDDEARTAAATLADIASAYVLHAQSDEQAKVLNSQLQTALHSRVPIEQAKGYVAGRLDVPIDKAFGLLRRYARSNNRTLHSVVQDVLHQRLATSELRAD